MSKEKILSLAEQLRPLAQLIKTVSLRDANAARAQIEKIAPFHGPLIKALRQQLQKADDEGWLLPKENAGVRFGRLAKDLEGFSVDAVWMNGPGPRHRHGNGEIDLCFATKGPARFDGQPEGWVVYGPGSVHVPTVSEGEMLIVYFLPAGAIDFF